MKTKIVTLLLVSLNVNAQTRATCTYDEYGNPLVCAQNKREASQVQNDQVRNLSQLEKWVLKNFGVPSLCEQGKCVPYINGNP